MQEHSYQKKPWASLVNSSNGRLATKDAIDLLSKMLVVDHNERISTDEALKHPFFK
jgi:serine/threonine protein kinase